MTRPVGVLQEGDIVLVAGCATDLRSRSGFWGRFFPSFRGEREEGSPRFGGFWPSTEGVLGTFVVFLGRSLLETAEGN